MNDLLKTVIDVSKGASEIIVDIYQSNRYKIDHKKDQSPITLADTRSNEYICKRLLEETDFPVVSEERYVDYETRKGYDYFWLVDPLDGTKDFIAKNDEFTVNIALISKDKPVLGVINVPAKDRIYYAYEGNGAYCIEKDGRSQKLPVFNKKDLIAAVSRFHDTEKTRHFLDINNIKNTIRVGAALKWCYLAKGEVNIYPRFVGSKEWDTAAGHIIVSESGCVIHDIVTGKELIYNKKDIRNNFFVACNEYVELDELIIENTV